jgi:two-component system nitrate/nitrite response regulator NarL
MVRVLLCDDHVLFAESLGAVLTDAGHDVVGVTHSPDAVLAALRGPATVDACVLDVGFGSDSIVHWLADLRAAAPETRLVLLTAHLDADVVAVALAHGVHGVAHKSQHVTDMVAILERVHAGETVVDRSLLSRPVGTAGRESAQRLADRLTPREREALCHLVRGLDTTQLARAMGVTWATARSHVQSVLTKLGVHSRLEAATVAIREGLVTAGTGEWRLG